jgi:hypothetical protein
MDRDVNHMPALDAFQMHFTRRPKTTGMPSLRFLAQGNFVGQNPRGAHRRLPLSFFPLLATARGGATFDFLSLSKMKYVLVSGGVISGIGKGLIASSTGLLLKTIGLKICLARLESSNPQC